VYVRIILNVNGGVEMGYIFNIDWTGHDVGHGGGGWPAK
jgi:hypothetical protein